MTKYGCVILVAPTLLIFEQNRLLISTRRILLSVIHDRISHYSLQPLLHNTESERAPTYIHYQYKMSFNIRGPIISLSNILKIRALQAVLATIYLILICYSSVHRGWWLNLRRPLVFGGMCSCNPTLTPSYLPSALYHYDQEINVFNLLLHIYQPKHVTAYVRC